MKWSTVKRIGVLVGVGAVTWFASSLAWYQRQLTNARNAELEWRSRVHYYKPVLIQKYQEVASVNRRPDNPPEPKVLLFPQTDHRFYLFSVMITNKTKISQSFSTSNVRIVGADDNDYYPLADQEIAFEQTIRERGYVEPNGSFFGDVVIEMPNGVLPDHAEFWEMLG